MELIIKIHYKLELTIKYIVAHPYIKLLENGCSISLFIDIHTALYIVGL